MILAATAQLETEFHVVFAAYANGKGASNVRRLDSVVGARFALLFSFFAYVSQYSTVLYSFFRDPFIFQTPLSNGRSLAEATNTVSLILDRSTPLLFICPQNSPTERSSPPSVVKVYPLPQPLSL